MQRQPSSARHGIRVHAHAHGTEGILAVIRADVASIEHGSKLTSEAISLMNERGVWLVPQAGRDAYRSTELLGVDDRGRISPGLRADLIAVAGDPTQEIKAQPAIRFIMKGGKVFRRP